MKRKKSTRSLKNMLPPEEYGRGALNERSEIKGKSEIKERSELKGKSGLNGKSELKGKSELNGRSELNVRSELNGRNEINGRSEFQGSKSEKIFQALAAADEELLVRSEQKAGIRLVSWRTLTPMAACLCMAVAGILMWQTGLMRDQGAAGGAPGTANQDTEMIADIKMEDGYSMGEGQSMDEEDKGDGGRKDEAEMEAASAQEDGAVQDNRIEDLNADRQKESAYGDNQDKTGAILDAVVPLTELPALVFVEKQEIEEAKTEEYKNYTSHTMSEEEIAGIWGADSTSGVSWEGLNPFEQYDIIAAVTYDGEGKVTDIEIQGSGKEAAGVTFRIHMAPGQEPVSDETALLFPTCQIHGTDVAAAKYEYTLQEKTISVYEAEFIKEGRESVGVRIRVEGIAAQGREMAFDLITRFVSGFLRE